MKSLKYWIHAVAVDLSMATLAYLWIARGIDGALNVLLFFTWVIIVARLLGGFVADKTTFEKNKRPRGFGFYHGVTELIMAAFFAWNHMMVTAAFFVVASILLETARTREPRAKEEGQQS